MNINAIAAPIRSLIIFGERKEPLPPDGLFFEEICLRYSALSI